MKQIKILLSSVLTLLLITSNNAYAAPHYSDYSGKPGFKAKQPNMNSGGRFMPKRNRLGDDISGYGYKNILKKGNVFRGFSDGVDDFRGNVRMLPNRNSGGVFSSNPFQAISEDQAIMTRPYRLGEDVGSGTPLKRGSSSWRDSGKVEVGNSRQNWGYRVNERKFIGEDGRDGFIVQADEVSFIGETGKAGFIGQADIIDGTSNTVSPKGVQLEFINGKWVERDRSTGATRRRGDVVYDENGKDGFIGQAGLIGENGKDGFIVQADEVGFIGTAGKDGLHNNGAFRAGKAGYTECDEKGGVRAADCPKGGIQAGKDRFIGEAGLIGENGKVGIFVQDVGQEAKAVGDKTWNELQPRALGPDVVTTLEHGPGVVNDNDSRITFPDDLGPPGIVSGTGAGALQQPKGVPLKFINGEWVEDQSLKPYAWP